MATTACTGKEGAGRPMVEYGNGAGGGFGLLAPGLHLHTHSNNQAEGTLQRRVFSTWSRRTAQARC